jgi:hypothetical protein
MTDNQSASGAPGAQARPTQPFPVERLLFSIGFAVIAWFVFWVALLLAVLQFVVTAIAGKVNEELRGISRNVVAYLDQLLSYIGFSRDERPFPLGPFPKS